MKKLFVAVGPVIAFSVCSHAVPVVLTNASFEAGPAIFTGFDVPGRDVPGWMDAGYIEDSGVDGPAPWFGALDSYASFHRGGDEGMYQITGYTIQPGDVFTVGFWAKGWTPWGEAGAEMTAFLFYGGNIYTSFGFLSATNLTRANTALDYEYFEGTFNAPTGSVGQVLGIHFINTGTTNSYANVDDISIHVSNATAPLGSVSGSPTGILLTNSVTLQAVVVEQTSIVDTNSTVLYLDGSPVAAIFDRSLAPTTTISYVANDLVGIHTGKVVVVGDPSGTATNEWTFSVGFGSSVPITLVHHWDFMDGGGTTVTDVVGGANGTIVGAQHGWITGGGLDLYGGGISSDWNYTTSSSAGSYVDLPNGIISALPGAATIEVVYTPQSDDIPNWQRVWDFGTNEQQLENVAGTGTEFIILTPGVPGVNDVRLLVATTDQRTLQLVDTTSLFIDNLGVMHHIVFTYDTDHRQAELYVNGVLCAREYLDAPAAWPLSELDDINNWLGRSQYDNNPMFGGRIYDLRIYTGIMTPAEVAARYNEIPPIPPVIDGFQLNGTNVAMSWTAEMPGTYSVLHTTNLIDGSWTPLLTGQPAGFQPPVISSTDEDQEFYRIVEE